MTQVAELDNATRNSKRFRSALLPILSLTRRVTLATDYIDAFSSNRKCDINPKSAQTGMWETEDQWQMVCLSPTNA